MLCDLVSNIIFIGAGAAGAGVEFTTISSGSGEQATKNSTNKLVMQLMSCFIVTVFTPNYKYLFDTR
ncbi:hypothetical protein GCM10007414_03450 [Agarivorans gilvus]|uniref:Uncharacterized protein n=1 Tax=Agarivorans gilvus TaxID=680279 RepID=A0ABQ1HVW7_9ALTE|nr:hypothetical protein GCM10007414_03450 [Agarivorans gilvus]